MACGPCHALKGVSSPDTRLRCVVRAIPWRPAPSRGRPQATSVFDSSASASRWSAPPGSLCPSAPPDRPACGAAWYRNGRDRSPRARRSGRGSPALAPPGRVRKVPGARFQQDPLSSGPLNGAAFFHALSGALARSSTNGRQCLGGLGESTAGFAPGCRDFKVLQWIRALWPPASTLSPWRRPPRAASALPRVIGPNPGDITAPSIVTERALNAEISGL